MKKADSTNFDEKLSESIAAWRARQPKPDTDGVIHVGDVRGLFNPEDKSDLRHVCVLADPSSSNVLVAMVDADRTFTSQSDLFVPGASELSTVPYDIVIDGVIHFRVPATALGISVGQIDEGIVRAILFADTDAPPEPLITGLPIRGTLDVRADFKRHQLAFAHTVIEHYRNFIDEIGDWYFNVPEYFTTMKSNSFKQSDIREEMKLMHDLRADRKAFLTRIPEGVERQVAENRLYDVETWQQVAGNSGKLMYEVFIATLRSSHRRSDNSATPVGPSNIRELVRAS